MSTLTVLKFPSADGAAHEFFASLFPNKEM